MPRIGIIRVLTTDDQQLLAAHGRLLEEFIKHPDLEVINRCIEGYPQGLAEEKDIPRAIPKIVHLGQEMVHEEKVTALLVSCAADPGVSELRQAVDIPVIGAGSASAAMAFSLGHPVGALGITDWRLPAITDTLGPRLVGWETPEGVNTTLDLMSDRGRKRFIQAGERLKRQGAQIILLACTGFSTIRIAPLLERRLRLPVIDPLIASGFVAYYVGQGNDS